MPAEATEMLGSAAHLPSVQREDTMQLSEEEEVNRTSRWREFLEWLSIPAGQLALAMRSISPSEDRVISIKSSSPVTWCLFRHVFSHQMFCIETLIQKRIELQTEHKCFIYNLEKAFLNDAVSIKFLMQKKIFFSTYWVQTAESFL